MAVINNHIAQRGPTCAAGFVGGTRRPAPFGTAGAMSFPGATEADFSSGLIPAFGSNSEVVGIVLTLP